MVYNPVGLACMVSGSPQELFLKVLPQLETHPSLDQNACVPPHPGMGAFLGNEDTSVSTTVVVIVLSIKIGLGPWEAS